MNEATGLFRSGPGVGVLTRICCRRACSWHLKRHCKTHENNAGKAAERVALAPGPVVPRLPSRPQQQAVVHGFNESVYDMMQQPAGHAGVTPRMLMAPLPWVSHPGMMASQRPVVVRYHL